MLTLKEIEELEELEKSAKAGSWQVIQTEYVSFMGRNFHCVVCGDTAICSNRMELENAELIAKSRNALPELLKMARELLELKNERR